MKRCSATSSGTLTWTAREGRDSASQRLGKQGLKVLRRRHDSAVLGSVAINGVDVELGVDAFLQVAAAKELFRHLAGNREDGAVAVLSVHGAGEGVGGAGSGGHQDDAELPRGPVVAVGQESRPALVPANHVLEALAPVLELVQNVHRRRAGYAEDVVNPLQLQIVQETFRDGDVGQTLTGCGRSIHGAAIHWFVGKR